MRFLTTALLTIGLVACTASITPPAPSYDFEESGRLVRNNPGLTPGVWYLLYEEEGSPALTTRLTFDDASLCIVHNTRGPCERSIFKNDLTITVRGMQENEGVKVGEMEM